MKKLASLVAWAFCGFLAHASTVNWSAQNDTGFATSTGAALPQGDLIRIGYFTISDAAVAALANPTTANIATLNTDFVQFGTATVGQTFGLDGFFQASSSLLYSTHPTFNSTSQIYIWALNASSLSAATEQAIFYEPFSTGTSSNKAAWQFPASDLLTASPDIGDAKLSLGGVYLAGSYQANNAALSTILGSPAGAVQLQGLAIPVPEPATLAVGVLAALAAMGTRTRRRA